MTGRADLPVERVRVAVVGGGPSGLTAAAALAGRVDGEVRVIEREDTAGGIPRHSAHLGYGARDLHRFVSGPSYARRLDEAAREAGASLHTQAQVTGWDGDRRLVVTSPRGRHVVEAEAIVLATGARERPRAARRIPGDRPEGVYTTGELQNLVHLNHARVGRRAVVVGAELVSWSAVLTLRGAGCRAAAMTSIHERPEAYLAFRWAGRLALRPQVLTRSRVVRINGRHRVESVLVEDIGTGTRTLVPCDTVVLTGDWIPDHELARSGGVTLDRSTLGPVVDSSLRTSIPGVYAVGNLLHPVDTADGAALDGRHVVDGVLAHLGDSASAPPAVELVASAPFRWVTPQRLVPAAPPPRDHLLLWPDAYRRLPVVRAVQDGRVLARRRLPWPAAPGRIFRVPADLVASATVGGGPVELGLEQGHR
jgi:thioredoxin reductase